MIEMKNYVSLIKNYGGQFYYRCKVLFIETGLCNIYMHMVPCYIFCVWLAVVSLSVQESFDP